MKPAAPDAPTSDAHLRSLLAAALDSGDDGELRQTLAAASGLPGPRLDLRLVGRVASAVVRAARDPDRVDAIEQLLGNWLNHAAGTDDAEVVLACAAALSYGAVGADRPEWWLDEIRKLSVAAIDPRWRVRELVAAGLQRMLAADWDRTVEAMRTWAGDTHPLRVRAAVAAVAEPPLLRSLDRWASAQDVQARAIASLRSAPAEVRRTDDVRTLRQALGYSLSVVAAASGDFSLLEQCATSGDTDLRWVAASNAKKNRLARWPAHLATLRALLAE